MIVLPDGLVMQHRKRIIEFAALQRIPAISGWSEFAKSGGTMTYGPNLKALFQRLAIYVDKILKGANPGELAVNWNREPGEDVAHLSIAWSEVGGPAVAASPDCRYGVSIIRDLIPQELGGSVDLSFASSGLCCKRHPL